MSSAIFSAAPVLPAGVSGEVPPDGSRTGARVADARTAIENQFANSAAPRIKNVRVLGIINTLDRYPD